MDHQEIQKLDGDNITIDVEGLEQLVLKLEDEIKHEPVDPLEENFDEFLTDRNGDDHLDVIAKILRDQQNPEIVTELMIDSNRRVVQHKKKKSGNNNKVLSSALQDTRVDVEIQEINQYDRNYVCFVCYEYFNDSKTLKKHMSSKHKKEKQVKKKSEKKTTTKKANNKKPKVLKSVKVSAAKSSSDKIISTVSSNDNITPPEPSPNEQIDQLPLEIAIKETYSIQSDQLKPIENCVDSNIAVETMFDIDNNDEQYSGDSSEVNIDSDIQNEDDIFFVRKKKVLSSSKRSATKSTKKSTLLMDSSDLLKEITKDRAKLVSKKGKDVKAALKIISNKGVWGPCEVCQKSFSSSSSFGRHIRMHGKSTSIECNVCHKKFARLSHLKRHATVHTGKKIFQCNLCPRSFDTGIKVQEHHILSHTDLTDLEDAAPEVIEKPYSCDTCGARFKWSESLKLHSEKICKRELFKCEYCDYKHELQSVVKNHQVMHTGERNYTCDTCNFKFNRRCHLLRHMKKMHRKKTWHECTECAEEFFYEAKLTEHYSAAHGITKPYGCDQCDMKFKNKKGLVQHKLSHNTGEGSFECEICYKKLRCQYSMKYHLLLHNRHEIYTCGKCDKKFLDLNKIRKHIEDIHFEPAQPSL